MRAVCCGQGYYDTMDAGVLTEDGNIAVMARSDDVINVAGHRLSTGALEEVLDMFDVTSWSFLLHIANDHYVTTSFL